eukprot:TRINITY_DN28511_c0_g2_i1.p1 TRINITY_DN28511_c0_g2~~TRINITY_DN28511_c0_g2_i1.p1  ORF type:complete len:115 (-),score=6.75 TRINITY_DN28511_c0_g2_i1:22-366(-)
MDRGAPVRWGSTAYADAFTWRVATVPSLKPFFALRSTFFRNLMRPAPVVRRRMAWTDQWYLLWRGFGKLHDAHLSRRVWNDLLPHLRHSVWEWCPLSPFDVVPFVMLWLSQWLQ